MVIVTGVLVLLLSASGGGAPQDAFRAEDAIVSAYPGAAVQLDAVNGGGTMVFKNETYRWKLDCVNADIPAQGAATQFHVLQIPYKIVPNDENVGMPDLPAKLIRYSETDGYKSVSIDEKSCAAHCVSLSLEDFVGLGSEQLLLRMQATFLITPPGEMTAGRFLLYDPQDLRLLFAATEFGSFMNATKMSKVDRQITFDTSSPPPYPIIIANAKKGLKKVVAWGNDKYDYVDDAPWNGINDEYDSLGYDPFEVTVRVRLPDGTPARGARVEIQTSHWHRGLDESERSNTKTDDDGVIHVLTGLWTRVEIRLEGFKRALVYWRPYQRPNQTQTIVLEKVAPLVEVCDERRWQHWVKETEIRNLGIVFCAVGPDGPSVAFSDDLQHSDVIVAIDPAANPSVGGTDAVRSVRLLGLHGWEFAPVTEAPREKEEMIEAPENGYVARVDLVHNQQIRFYIRNAGQGRYGKLFDVFFFERKESRSYSFIVGVDFSVQRSNQNTRALNPFREPTTEFGPGTPP